MQYVLYVPVLYLCANKVTCAFYLKPSLLIIPDGVYPAEHSVKTGAGGATRSEEMFDVRPLQTP